MPLVDSAENAIFLFAWVAEGTAWSDDLARCDEDVFAFSITHQENECATLQLDVENPKIGLLAAGRNLWGWLTERKANGDLAPRFYGRLMGIPEDLQDFVVRLQFQAKPVDFDAQKAAIADGLRELPWYDPIWLEEGADDDPDNALETRPLAWCIDRVTLEVSVSDVGQGEDGTLTLTADDHYIDGVSIDVGQTPLTQLQVSLAVTWTQAGAGDVDLTQQIYDAFVATGTPFQYPLVGSFTSDGLLSNWPAPAASIGAGWTVGDGAIAESVAWQKPASKKVRYTDKPVIVPSAYQLAQTPSKIGDLPIPTQWTRDLDFNKQGGLPVRPLFELLTPAEEAALGWTNWDVLFEVDPILQQFPVHYETARARTERVTFTLNVGVQPLLTDPEGADVEVISLTSSAITSPVDEGGATPLADVTQNSYFPTDRGQLSLQYGMLLARAHAYVRARSISITVEPVWEIVIDHLSLRKNLIVQDSRFPGGQVAGKIIAYTISSDGAGQPMQASVTIGCMVGTAEVLPDVDEALDDYADDYSDDYDEQEEGGHIAVVAGALRYQSFDGAYVVDDDGLDLKNMTPGRVVTALVVNNGVGVQETAINDSKADPVGGLRAFPTSVDLSLVPLTGASFETDYAVTVETLYLPKSIDLAAPSL